MENVISEWLRCPVCGNKTRLKIRGDTELKYFPLFCPKWCGIKKVDSLFSRIS
ncbi:MAG: cysteine-rich KTR domain-containing protein [Lacrimispora saccharolytica]